MSRLGRLIEAINDNRAAIFAVVAVCLLVGVQALPKALRSLRRVAGQDLGATTPLSEMLDPGVAADPPRDISTHSESMVDDGDAVPEVEAMLDLAAPAAEDAPTPEERVWLPRQSRVGAR